MAILRLERNGAITVAEHGEPDRVLDSTDPLALLAHIRSMPEFEQGLTVAETMQCLRPWADVLSRMGWCDFVEWDRALAIPPRRLLDDAADPTQKHGEPPLGSVVIAPTISTTAEQERQWSLDITWETRGVFAWPRVDHHTGHQDLYCSLSFTPPAQWAHLPIRIEQRAWIGSMDLAGTDRKIFTEEVVSTNIAPSTVEVAPSFLDAIVLGFLDDISFYGNPDETSEIWEEVLETAEAVRYNEMVDLNRRSVFLGKTGRTKH
ncbi:hypothetical protein [Azospirillum argentinense]